MILLFCWVAMALLGVPRVYQVLALSTLLGWPILMFSYLHDRMHIGNFSDDASSSPQIIDPLSQKTRRHSPPQREQQRLHGHQLRHRLLLF